MCLFSWTVYMYIYFSFICYTLWSTIHKHSERPFIQELPVDVHRTEPLAIKFLFVPTQHCNYMGYVNTNIFVIIPQRYIAFTCALVQWNDSAKGNLISEKGP